MTQTFYLIQVITQIHKLPKKNGNPGGVAILVRDGLNLAAWDCTLPDFDFACGTVLSTDP